MESHIGSGFHQATGIRFFTPFYIEPVKNHRGYEWLRDQWNGINEFPPRPQKIAEISGAVATAQLVEPVYTAGTTSIAVVPSFGATAHKHDQFSIECETRVEAVVGPETLEVKDTDTLIRWPITALSELGIIVGPKVEPTIAARIAALAREAGIMVRS